MKEMAKDLERETAASLIGQVEKRKATGDHQIDIAKLIRRLARNKKAVIGNFCQGCGAYFNLHEKGAGEMAKLSAKIAIPPSWEGFFFLSRACVLCDPDEKFRQVTLEEIGKYKS